jgi:hypothetical protein
VGKAGRKGNTLMKPAPPKAVETVVGILIPPSCREHVLGDLHERYQSPGQYLGDVLSTVSSVIVSQIRRTTDPQVFLMGACALYASFLGAAWISEGISFLNAQAGFVRLAIPVLTALFTLLLANAYITVETSARYAPILKPALAIAFAFLSQAILRAVNPELSIPVPIMTFGGGVGVLLLATLGVLFPQRTSGLREATAGGDAVISPDDISRRAEKLQRELRFNRFEVLLVAVFVALLGGGSVSGKAVSDRILGAIIVAAAVYVIYQLYRRRASAIPAGAKPAVLLESYRTQLERRRDDLRRIWSWCAGPIFIALMAFALRFPIARWDQPNSWRNILPFVILSLFWFFAMLHIAARRARELQREIDRLNTLKKD